MKKIEEIWKELENEQSLNNGLLFKRFSSTIKPDIYVALKSPEKLRCVALHLNSIIHFKLKNWDNLKDIKIELLPDENHSDKQFLLITLLEKQHQDIFSTLSEDLFNIASDIKQESELIKIVLMRLEKWRLLFEKLGRQGLPPESQRGLYGELFFVRQFIEFTKDSDYCINSWKGPAKAVQDFQYSDWAVEIKTTHGKNQQKLHISNERQLDISLVPNIFLIHYSLETREKYGETLNELIDNLLEALYQSPVYNLFKIKLFEVGYFEIHRDLYSDTGYSIRQEKIYKITDDFPKITESMIPSGVGDVKYSIVLNDKESWEIILNDLFNQINKRGIC